MNITQFIQTALIQDIADIIQAGKHYHTFSLIAQGIELLGASLDEEPFHSKKRGLSSTRFRTAIDELFPITYQVFNQGGPYDLYANLRCGLLHVVLPQQNLELIQRSERGRFCCGHLGFDHQRGNKRLVLVSEDFYADFSGACWEVIRRIEAGELNHDKLQKMRLAV